MTKLDKPYYMPSECHKIIDVWENWSMGFPQRDYFGMGFKHISISGQDLELFSQLEI